MRTRREGQHHILPPFDRRGASIADAEIAPVNRAWRRARMLLSLVDATAR